MTSTPLDIRPRSRPEQAPAPWGLRLLILSMLGAMLFVCAVLALISAYQFTVADKVIPGVYAFGVPLGGMTRDEAARVLSDHFAYDQQTVFTFRDGERTWEYTAAELGVMYDPERTVDEALAYGRGGSTIDALVTQVLTWLNGRAITPLVTYDQSKAAVAVQSLAAAVDQQGADASLQIDGTSISAAPLQIGRTLDVNATLARLNSAINSLADGAVIDVVVSEMPVTVQGIELAESRAKAALSGPLTVFTDDGSGQMIGPWTISTDQIAASLRVEQTVGADGLRTYDVSVDFSGFAAYLRELAPGLLTAPQDGRFDFDETTRQLSVLQPSSGGRSLNVEATIARMEQQVFSTTERSVAMVYDYTPARYHDGVTAAELGITELIGEATTYYRGSQSNRRTNIAVSVSRFDGVIIGPGEEFSFNTLLGEISPEAGFLEDNLIFGGRTILGIGGGVCQVSTTAFRAAFYAGYTIIERNSHGYRVGYYEQNGQPPGLDAAIWQPERDFRFQNDTPYHLLIEVDIYPANDALQFRMYSTPTGRTVEVETPRVSNLVPPVPDRFEVNNDLRPGEILQVDYSAQGADVNVTRTITYPDGTVKKDNIFTHYLPWGAIYQVAPGDARLSS
jgi:vancomycin resistance protein YoaR